MLLTVAIAQKLAKGGDGKVVEPKPAKGVIRAGFGRGRSGWKYLPVPRCVVDLGSSKAEATGFSFRASPDLRI